MEQIFILIVAGLTSVGSYILGVKGLRLSRSELWLALGRACECVGLTLAFFLLNMAVAMFVILAGRSLSGRFVSIYIASDITLLIVSLLQALAFQAWRESSRQRHTYASKVGELVHREP
jgi:type IV secretory pathway VirB3-like protein